MSWKWEGYSTKIDIKKWDDRSSGKKSKIRRQSTNSLHRKCDVKVERIYNQGRSRKVKWRKEEEMKSIENELIYKIKGFNNFITIKFIFKTTLEHSLQYEIDYSPFSFIK